MTSAYAVIDGVEGFAGDPDPVRVFHLMTEIDPTSDSAPEEILQHCIDSLSEVLSITSPANMARVQRISRVTAALGARCGVSRPHHLSGTGHELSDIIIQRLQTLAERQVIRELVLVAMLDDDPAVAGGSPTQ